jgi:excisionase family DNA binding protein
VFGLPVFKSNGGKHMLISQQDYLTVSEAAAYLRVSADSVRRWAREGHLKAMKVGLSGQYRITPEDLQTMVKKAS